MNNTQKGFIHVYVPPSIDERGYYGEIDPLWFFSNFLRNPMKYFEKNGYEMLEASICDVLMVQSLLGVDPTQSYEENTKSPTPGFHIKPIEN